MNRILLFALCTVTSATLLACQKEGAVEKAGEKVDEVVEKIQHGDEGALEKAGRKVDEAVDDAKGGADD